MNSEERESEVESNHPDVAVLYRCWQAGFGEMFSRELPEAATPSSSAYLSS
jgi:hypothetical protein